MNEDDKVLFDELKWLLGYEVKSVAVHEDGISVDLEGSGHKFALVCQGKGNVHLVKLKDAADVG